MATIEEALVSRLKNFSGLQPLIGDRIFPRTFKQGSTLPLVVYNRVGTNPVYSNSAPSGLVQATFQLDSFARDFLAAKEIASQVSAALGGFSGGILGLNITGIIETDHLDGFDDDPELYRVTQRFSVWYNSEG